MNNMIDAIILFGGIVIGGIIFFVGVKLNIDKEKANPTEKHKDEENKAQKI